MKKEQLRKIEKHAYLKEIHGGELPFPCTDKSYPKFDIRDTYSLDYTMLDWLYERLRFFQDEVSKYVDLDYADRKIIIDGEAFTQRQCIDRMVDDIREINKAEEDSFNKLIELCHAKGNGDIAVLDYEKRFLENNNIEDARRNAASEDLFKVLSKCFWYMWW